MITNPGRVREATGESRTRRGPGSDRRAGAAAERPCAERLEHRRLFSAGDLDVTFGEDGKVTAELFGRQSGGVAVVQPDGKAIVVGTSSNYTLPDGTPLPGSDFSVVRFNTDGSLDMTF